MAEKIFAAAKIALALWVAGGYGAGMTNEVVLPSDLEACHRLLREQHVSLGEKDVVIAECRTAIAAKDALVAQQNQQLVEQKDTGGIFFGMCEEDMWRILAQPWVMIGCDASLRAPDGILSKDHPHPRAYGSFTKLLRASLDGQTVPLPEMIRKMTSLAAEQFHLDDRGVLKTGNFADVVIFDPNKIEEKTNYLQPHQLSTGIKSLIVNGTLTIQNGALTGLRNGLFLA